MGLLTLTVYFDDICNEYHQSIHAGGIVMDCFLHAHYGSDLGVPS